MQRAIPIATPHFGWRCGVRVMLPALLDIASTASSQHAPTAPTARAGLRLRLRLRLRRVRPLLRARTKPTLAAPTWQAAASAARECDVQRAAYDARRATRMPKGLESLTCEG